MAETLKDFLISIGFGVDESGAAKVESVVNRTEARLTSATVEALNKRRQAEDQALADRINAITSVGQELNAEEKAAAARFLRTQSETADKERKLQEESAKKQREHHDKTFKTLQEGALRVSGIITKVFATAVGGTSASIAGIAYAVDKSAQAFDKLAFMSQRVGSSPGSILGFGFAASQTGGSRAGGEAALESLGERLRKFPAYAQQLRGMGVNTSQGTAGIAADLGGVLNGIAKRQGYVQAIAQASVFGLDEITARAIMDPSFKAKMAEAAAANRRVGADPQRASAAGQAFSRTMGSLGVKFDAIQTRVTTSLMEKMQPLMERFGRWLDANGQRVADALVKIGEGLLKVVEAVASFVEKIGPENAVAILGVLGAAFLAFGALLAVKVLAPLGKLVGLIGTLSSLALPGWLAKMMGIAGVGGAILAGGAAAVGGAVEAGKAFGESDSEAAQNHRGYGPIDMAAKAWRGAKRALGMGGSDGAGNPNAGSAPAASRAAMMAYATDQLRKEGVPEGNLRAAAAHLVGQADMESGLDPSKEHDNRTGYGIYGARLGRRDQMLAWMKQNGYGANSAEGQMRYMSHEAMQGNSERTFPKTRRILMGADAQRFGADTDTITGEFEAPKIINQRSGAVSRAYATPKAVAPAAPGLPPGGHWGKDGYGNPVAIDAQGRSVPVPAGAAAPVAASINKGAKAAPEAKSPWGALSPQVFQPKAAPLGVTPSMMSTTNNSRGDQNITHNPVFNIHGPNTESAMSAARTMASRGQQDLLRNMQASEQ